MNGFESPNHTQTPNDLFDVLMRDMGETELKVTMAVIRGTLGYHKDGFKLSLSKMAEMTGLSENGVIAGAEQAEARGLIERVIDGRKSTEWRVRFSTSASEARRKRRTSASEVELPQPVRQSTSPSEGQLGLNKDKETKIAREKTPRAGEREKHRRPPEHMQFSKDFTEITGIQWLEPKGSKAWAAAEQLWNQPLDRMLERANGQSESILRASVKYMKDKGWPVTGPNSVEKTFTMICGERNLSGMKSATTRDPFAPLRDMLERQQKEKQ